MAITYRDTKGSNLTPAEGDANIRTLVAADATLQTNIDNAVAFIPVKITDAATISLLINGTYVNNIYTGTAITTQKEGDWYDSGTIEYKFITNLIIRRIPYANL